MFEQSLYDTEPVAAPQQEGDLFHNYEVKNWDFGKRIYQILAIAGAANLLALLITAQTSLLTMKGCDSPLVGSVCQVLDTLVVGAAIFGTEREYIDAAYEKTDLGDADITFVDVSNTAPPLSYPEGYFQLANPEQFITSVEQPADTGITGGTFPGIPSYTSPSRSGSSMLDTPPKKLKKNDDILGGGTLPDDIDDTTASSGDKGKGKGKATPTPTPDETTAQNPKVDPTGPVADVELNKRPWVDLGNKINTELKDVNLETPFIYMATAKLDKDGRIDAKSFKVKRAESPDKRMLEVVKKAIEAMDESKYLQYLSMVGVKDISFVVQQDNDNVTAFVESQFENDLRPKTVSTLLNSYIATKKEAKQAPDASPNDKDDLVLLQNASVAPNGKKIVISFSIPKADVQRMLQRKLAEQKATPKPQPQNNNVSSGKVMTNTAQK